MRHLFLPAMSVLAACAPPPQNGAMADPTPDTASPKVAEDNASSGRPADSPAAANGRRILSTAFVRIGPDGHLTVERRDGSTLVLRDVVMQPTDYCGVLVVAGVPRGKHCGAYDDVAAARPGGGRSW